MTDLLTGTEGVNVSTQIASALKLPRLSRLDRQIRRFGFEYEMLPRSYRERDSNYDDGDCDCDECTGGCGIGYDGGRAPDLVERAHANSLIADGYLHAYHCHCSTCSYDRTQWLLVAQTDCSVGVEFVSRILDLQRDDWPECTRQINEFVEMMHGWKNDGHWMPDGDYGCGNHIHVAQAPAEGDWEQWTAIDEAARHIDAIYAVFDWDGVADGGCGQVRGYNSKPTYDGGYGSWLSKRTHTFEHRLWNTPYNPDLLWGHLGLSLAIQRWAFGIAERMPGFDFWDRSTRRTWGGDEKAMSDNAFDALANNLDRVVEGIRSYVPVQPEFAVARELISNLCSQ